MAPVGSGLNSAVRSVFQWQRTTWRDPETGKREGNDASSETHANLGATVFSIAQHRNIASLRQGCDSGVFLV